jgi:hypothetical protein
MILAAHVGDNRYSGPISIPASTPLVCLEWPTDGARSTSSNLRGMSLPETPERWCPDKVGSRATQLLLRRIKNPHRQD